MPAQPERDRGTAPAPAALDEALDQLLRFGAALLRAGNTAFRVRQYMGMVGRAMRFDALSVQVGLGGIIATGQRDGVQTTLLREVGPPGVNTLRIRALEELAFAATPDLTPRELGAKLTAIESSPPLYSIAQISAAIGMACGAFAFLNGADGIGVLIAALGGGIGQCLRTHLLRRHINQYAVTAVSAIIASGVYWLGSVAAARAGFDFAHNSAGFISSALFLIPGFPLVAALLDLLQHQTAASVTRFVYGMAVLLAAAFGLSVVTRLAGFDLSPAPPLEMGKPLLFALRGVASFAGVCGFAILFNSSTRAVLAAGVLGLAGNELRLALHDAGMMLGPATFLGALAVGFIASLGGRRFKEPRIALTVPGIIIMVPGMFAFQAIVLFNQGNMLEAMQATVQVGFVVCAMAIGLAAARFLTRREWLIES